MSIAVLNQVYDEVRRLAIAGSSLAAGDFRLKKLIAPLEQAGAKVPVFAKAAQAVQMVVDSNSETASAALLELSTLVTAVLYTQGATGAAGELQEIETQDFGLPTSDASARVLKPLVEALTTTGSGRLEIIRDAFERGIFKDLRLVKLAVTAIDDGYPEIGDFVADHILPIFGKAIYSDLRDSIDVKGKAGHVRRLRVLHRLDKAQTLTWVEQSLESGSKEMKIAAMECLRGSSSHVSFLLEQTKAKSKDVRRAAFEGLSECGEKEVVETFKKALQGSDIDLAVGPASRNASPSLFEFILQDGQRQLHELPAASAKSNLKSQLSRFHTFLTCFTARSDKQSEAFLIDCFQRRNELQNLKSDVSGLDILHRVAGLLVQNNSKQGQQQLVDAHASFAAGLLTLSMMAAARTRNAAEVYQLFSPYMVAKPSKNSGRVQVREKQQVVQTVIHSIAQSHHALQYGYYHRTGTNPLDNVYLGDWGKEVVLDPRWLDAAVEIQDLVTVKVLARPKHKGTIAFLRATIDEGLKASSHDIDYEMSSVLETMNRIEHPDTVDCFLAALEKAGTTKTNRYHYAYWMLRLIPDLPKSAAPRIEVLLPKLNERVIDEVILYVEKLKAR